MVGSTTARVGSRDVSTEALVATPKPSPLLHRIEAAQYDVVRNRERGLAQLGKMFREGVFPREPLDGPTNGQMIAADVAPHVTPSVVRLITTTKPWLGKTFDAEGARGENLLTPGFVALSRVLLPGYRGFRRVSEHAFAGLAFRTYSGNGLQDPDRRVLKIDYDTPDNPPMIRRILDELVQLDDNYYLGKAHFRLSLTSWHLLFVFALQRR
jgi:hypothetical protein